MYKKREQIRRSFVKANLEELSEKLNNYDNDRIYEVLPTDLFTFASHLSILIV